MRITISFFLIICLSLFSCSSTPKKIDSERETDPQYMYNLGLFYLNNGNLDEALKHLDKALSLNPQNFLVLNALGLTYYMQGNFNRALESFQKCLEINPEFIEAHNNMGTIYLEMGFIDKAEEEYQKVLLDKTYSSKELPYYNLAKLYYNQNKIEQALDYIQKAINKNNRFAAAYNLKGLILEKLNNFSEAIKSYEQAIKFVPGEVNFSFNLAVALFKNREYNKAKNLFEKISSQVTDPEMKGKIDQYLKMLNK